MSVFRKAYQSSEPSEPSQIPSKLSALSLHTKKKERPQQAPEETGIPTMEDFLNTGEELERESERGLTLAGQYGFAGAAGLPGNISQALDSMTGGNFSKFHGGITGLPTTEDISENLEKFTGLKADPKSRIAQAGKEFVQDVGSYLPLSGLASFTAGTGGPIINMARTWQPLITPLVGQVTKQTMHDLGAENSEDFWKLGSMIVTDVALNRGRGSQGYINHLFKEANSSLQPGITTNVNNFRANLLNLKHNLQRGGTSPTKTEALKKVDEILGKMTQQGNNYSIEVQEFPEFRKSINDIRDSLGGFKSETPPTTKRKIIRNLESVKKSVIDAGMDYGNSHNPDFAKYWKAANEAANIKSKSEFTTRFIEKTLSKPMFRFIMGGTGTGALAHTAGHVMAGASPLAAIGKTATLGVTGAVAATAIYNPVKIVYRMAKSPVLRSYYSKLFAASAKQDASNVGKYADKIKRELEKEEKEEEFLIKKYTSK